MSVGSAIRDSTTPAPDEGAGGAGFGGGPDASQVANIVALDRKAVTFQVIGGNTTLYLLGAMNSPRQRAH
jgi:hypothetical protein